MSGLQRLPRNEETLILDLARKNGLETARLRCEYTRQQDEGVGRFKGGGFLGGREYAISYDLMLCKWCGNLEGSRNNALYCPFKMNALKERLLSE